MTQNPTVGYMTEQINRRRLDGEAARGWLADEAVAQRSSAVRPARARLILGVAFIRLGERIQGTVRPTSILVNRPARAAWSTR